MDEVQTQIDHDNKFSWYSIRSDFTDGVLTNRLTVFDNGITVNDRFLDGTRVHSFQSDSELDSVKPWSSIETHYQPDGSVAGRLTRYDNGVIRDEQFQNGIRTQTYMADNPSDVNGAGTKPWDMIVTYYDEIGQIAAKVTRYDNGVMREESYENGVISHVRLLDNPEGEVAGTAKAWETIDRYYDAQGEIVASVTLLDNGVVRETEFQGGVKVRVLQLDNPGAQGDGVKPWQSIEAFYDENGEQVARAIVYDDGRLREDTYENGVLSSSEIRDGAFDGSSQYGWTTINIYYDQAGQPQHKVTIFDDGRVKTDDYVDGVRIASIIEDRFLGEGGNFAWDTIEFAYNPDGSIAARQTTYDDGDMVLLAYANGAVGMKAELDGDDSESWFIRLTDYNEDGTVGSVTTYDSYDEVPEFEGVSLIGAPELLG